MHKKTASGILFILFLCITCGLAGTGDAEDLPVGILLADDAGKILYSRNREKPFIPASTLKILTSLAALHILGEDHRFSIDYVLEKDSKNLYVKGFGDPLFISEVIETMSKEICLTSGVQKIQNIILDQSYFSDQIQVPGKSNTLNPYDASSGALCANFNTILFKWDARENRFVSGEPQTPLLPIFLDSIEKTRLQQGRIILSRQQSLLYPGLLIKHFLEKNNVRVAGAVLLGKFNDPRGEKVSFLSPFDLKAAVQKLLEYSNNYIANQLLLSIGARSYGPPATLEKGITAVKAFSTLQLNLEPFALFEGSGLSRSNRMSPDQMMKLMMAFMPYHSLLRQQGNEFYKTGTLTGVRTRVGYISGQDNRLYPYVIMVNQEKKGVDAILKTLFERVLTQSGKIP